MLTTPTSAASPEFADQQHPRKAKYLRFLAIPLMLGITIACQNQQPQQSNYKTTGSIQRLDAALDAIIDTNATIEIIAEGFKWSEGPLWVETTQMLLFSDVPSNTIYKWTEESGTEVYLQPSGYTGAAPTQSKEPGSNGLLLDHSGNLVLCQHGNRQVARMEAPLDKPAATFSALASQYEGMRFSSPNDAVYNTSGTLFFTDPPYGLPAQNDDDPAKEIPFNGVYKLTPEGDVILLTDRITRPNGIAFFPDGHTLLVASSDPNAANWYTLDVREAPTTPTLFYSATAERDSLPGLPDGLKITKNGTVFASGPGGVWIFNRAGRVLGKIELNKAASNVALSADEKTIYITNHQQVLRVKINR
ncbi:SMP-30/gluconolactonase/LRE family protein [Parapedobacter sp. 10938]|uniref:SMP-30/gluconolactonase/LRE family protein n=1 Tax=Parapedobacter flavus TaxID=3110225 RepID=UPI002DBD69DB|nr:SMP-30/gluconolactonase/LRE family protein [Parapedobacter sp. 10938]MEC3881589.1 SMP-30/gluconolactonase/LRE family protein [Parapedobacter sp. 10938]